MIIHVAFNAIPFICTLSLVMCFEYVQYVYSHRVFVLAAVEFIHKHR